MKKVVSLFLIIALVMSITACAKKETVKSDTSTKEVNETATTEVATEAVVEKEHATISFMMFQSWYKEEFKDIFAKIEKDENLTIDLQIVPDADFEQLLQTKVAVGEMPDVVTQNSLSAITLGVENLADLSNEPWVARLSNPNSITMDGKIKMFPLKGYSMLAGVWYNTKVFNDLGLTIPTTYDEFLAVCEAIKTKGNGITPLYMSDKDTWTTQMYIAGGLTALLGDSAKEKLNKVAVNQLKLTEIPEFKVILDKFFDLYKMGYINEDHLSATWDMSKEALATGKAAMVINGDWIMNDINRDFPDNANDIGLFPIPLTNNPVFTTSGTIQSLFVSASSKNMDAAKRFLSAYSQVDYQNAYYKATPCPVPAFNDCDGGPVFDVVQKGIDDYVLTGKTVYEFPDYLTNLGGPYWDSCVPNLVAGSVGEISSDEIIAQFQKALEELAVAKKLAGW